MQIRESAEDYLEAILVLSKKGGGVRSVDIATISVEVDDFEINDTVILFKDVQTGKQITFDTALPIYEVLYRNSTSMQIQGNGKNSELVVDLIVDPDIGNLLKVTASGVIVSSDDIISIFNGKIRLITFEY